MESQYKTTLHFSGKKIAVALALSITLASAGCGKGSSKNVKIEGVVGPNVSFVDNKLTMSVVLTQAHIDFGARIPVPYMPNSYLEVGPDFQSNGYLIHIGVDAGDVVKLAHEYVNIIEPGALPGGRPLPGVASGELPTLAVQVPKLNDIAFYAGPQVFGTFIPVALPWKDYMGTFRFYDGAGDPIGNISIVGSDAEGKNAGFLLLINLKGKVAKLVGMPI